MITTLQFSDAYRKYFAETVRTAGSHLDKFSQRDAEDKAQDAWLLAWRFQDSFKGDSNIRTWVHHILLNACRTHLRYLRHRPEGYLTDSDLMIPMNDHTLVNIELRADLDHILAMVPGSGFMSDYSEGFITKIKGNRIRAFRMRVALREAYRRAA